MSYDLSAQSRPQVGSRHARRLRAQGRVPASIAGEGKNHVDISIDLAEFLTARRKHEALFDIAIEGGAKETAVIRELQWDAFGDHIVHVEFRRVTRGVAIEAEVDLHFVGQSKNGVLTPTHDSLRIRAIPSKIPEAIEINVEHLPDEHVILAKHLRLPEGVSLACPADMAVAVLAKASAMDEPAAPDAPAAGATPAP